MAVANQEALNALLDATINTTEISTKYIPVPEMLYKGIVERYEFKDFPAKEVGELPSILLVVVVALPDPELAVEVERDEVKLRYETWLNRNKTGGLTNQNIGLGRLILAAGQIDLGEGTLLEVLDSTVGQELGVKVGNRPYQERMLDFIADVVPVSEV